jgi:hypothetical protein
MMRTILTKANPTFKLTQCLPMVSGIGHGRGTCRQEGCAGINSDHNSTRSETKTPATGAMNPAGNFDALAVRLMN